MANAPHTPIISNHTIVKNGVAVDVSVADPRWLEGCDGGDGGSVGADEHTIQTVTQAVLWAYQNSPFAPAMPIQTAPPQVEISVLLTHDAAIQQLNRDYRHKESATNVLAFALLDPTPDGVGEMPPINHMPPEGMPLVLGDIVLAYETIYRESQHQQKSMTAHITHLTIHGTLHLLGYDHTTPHDAQVMEQLEIQLLDQLGIANPYHE